MCEIMSAFKIIYSNKYRRKKNNRFADIKLLSKLSNFACSADKQVPIALSNKVNFFEPFPTNPQGAWSVHTLRAFPDSRAMVNYENFHKNMPLNAGMLRRRGK